MWFLVRPKHVPSFQFLFSVASFQVNVELLRKRKQSEILTVKYGLNPGGGGGLPYETDGDARRLA